jgi:hypothetical protein
MIETPTFVASAEKSDGSVSSWLKLPDVSEQLEAASLVPSTRGSKFGLAGIGNRQDRQPENGGRMWRSLFWNEKANSSSRPASRHDPRLLPRRLLPDRRRRGSPHANGVEQCVKKLKKDFDTISKEECRRKRRYRYVMEGIE